MNPDPRPQSGRAWATAPTRGAFPFTGADFHRIAALLRADVGIHLTETKAPLVYARLVKRVQALGLQSFHDYCSLVTGRDGADERRRMASALTTNVTRFFREPHHFEHLKSEVLPDLVRSARQGGRVRVWSAGCSSGEEPYSIALTLLSLLSDAADYDIKILATDIDHDMLQKARRGVYGDACVGPIDPALRKRWLTPGTSEHGAVQWTVREPLRNLVSFRELNLVGGWPMRGPFQVIFCRNTLIYFDAGLRIETWSRMAPLLSPGGLLYVGHSERIAGTSAFETVGLTTYVLKQTEPG
ncbi:protein-glutamate O-methyltransferase [Phenylobacterium sp.]|uniref:CheR family methyltransferase n=1 Tax=Phenylobacterium sp. TaxID=1871053 RepID=UPI002F42A129